MDQKGFWDWENRHAKLSDKKSLLDRIDEFISWEEFRPILEKIYPQHRLSNTGRKPIDPILIVNGTGRIWTADLALQIRVSFLTLWTIPSP